MKQSDKNLIAWGSAAILIGLLIFRKKTETIVIEEEAGRLPDITAPLPAVLIPDGYTEETILPDTPHIKGEVPIAPIKPDIVVDDTIDLDVIAPTKPVLVSDYPQKQIYEPGKVVDLYGNDYYSTSQYY